MPRCQQSRHAFSEMETPSHLSHHHSEEAVASPQGLCHGPRLLFLCKNYMFKKKITQQKHYEHKRKLRTLLLFLILLSPPPPRFCQMLGLLSASSRHGSPLPAYLLLNVPSTPHEKSISSLSP